MSGILDIINSIAVFQLVFFILFLFVRGNKVPSTLFLKLHLFSQLIGYDNYLYFIHEAVFFKPLLMLSMPCMFLWAPTFYFYVRSRLYKSFVPKWKLLIHSIPAFIIMMIIIYLLLNSENFHGQIYTLRSVLYNILLVQLLGYYGFTLYIIYKYRHDIKFLSSSNERRKLNWLFVITYGMTLTSLTIAALFYILNVLEQGWGYIVYWIFLNIFFFKAIIQTDQYLGIDEKKMLPITLTKEKCKQYYRQIEEIITRNQLFLDPDLSLHNVAQAVKLSDRIVSQVIKESVSLNFTDFINKKRIEYAKEVLRNTTKSEKNVLEILYEAGFNSKSVFNTQFKKHTGLSPTAFREMNRR
jgi:AraC-like DNA-binding protein